MPLGGFDADGGRREREHGVNFCKESGGGKRLHDLSAHTERSQFREDVMVSGRGEQDDGDCAERLVGPHHREELSAAHGGHVDVEEQKIRQRLFHGEEGVETIGRLAHIAVKRSERGLGEIYIELDK